MEKFTQEDLTEYAEHFAEYIRLVGEEMLARAAANDLVNVRNISVTLIFLTALKERFVFLSEVFAAAIIQMESTDKMTKENLELRAELKRYTEAVEQMVTEGRSEIYGPGNKPHGSV